MKYTFKNIQNVTLIGGGDTLLYSASKLIEAGFSVRVILAPRHATLSLPINKVTLSKALEELEIDYVELEDINKPKILTDIIPSGKSSMALCFGPAWIFQENILDWFGGGMFNFNGIPIPRYLGGAHYTWQILNEDRTAGIALQEITMEIDRGSILRFKKYLLPSNVRIPQDYFEGNFHFACKFIDQFVKDMKNNIEFHSFKYEALDGRRLYFPRLLTIPQGLINWFWSAKEIELFCRAFDRPYFGASTFLDGEKVHLKGVLLEKGDVYMHPFCSGLIVRVSKENAWIAAQGGFLVVNEIYDSDGNDVIFKLKEGKRFFTPTKLLEEALEFKPFIGSK
jgi:methionyl-tRNA formyltransferase